MRDARDRAILVAQRCSGQAMLMSSVQEMQTSRVLGPASTPHTPMLIFGVLTQRLPCTAQLFLLCSADVFKALGPRVLLPGSRRAGEVFCFAFARRRGRAGGWGAWGSWGHNCQPAQGLGHQPGTPRRGSEEELSPEQTMKAGGFFRRALVLLKQSRTEWLSQGSATSHRTGKWLLRSGVGWLWPSMATPQPTAWQRRVASAGDTPRVAATAPQSPCLCSSTKPEQSMSPSTSHSRGGPAEGRGGRKVIKPSRYKPGQLFFLLLSRKSLSSPHPKLN